MYQSMSTLLHCMKCITSSSLGIECIQQYMEISGELCPSSSCSSSSSSVHVSGRTAHKLFQISHSSHTLLDGSFLASHCSQYVSGCSSLVSHHKRSFYGCLGRPGAKGPAMSAFNILAAQRCVLWRQGFTSSVCQKSWGWLECVQQRAIDSVGKKEQIGVLKGCS